MWDLKDLEELQSEIDERKEDTFYEAVGTLLYMAVSALFGGVMTFFVLAVSQHLK